MFWIKEDEHSRAPHPKFCNVLGSGCHNCGLEGNDASAFFLAELIGQHLDPTDLKWRGGGKVEYDLIVAWNRLRSKLQKLIEVSDFGAKKPERGPQTRQALGRAILAAFARGGKAEARNLAKLMPTKESAVDACLEVIVSDFSLESKESLII